MLKTALTYFVRKYKNPSFSFDSGVSSTMLLSLLFSRLLSRLRSFRLMLSLRWPRALFFGKNVCFCCLNKISFGRSVSLGDYVYLSGLGRDGILLGDNVNIGDYSRLVVSTSFSNIGKGISIGDYVAIGEFSYIGGAGGVTIGGGSIIGQYFSVHPENHIYTNLDTEIRFQGVERQGISIGCNCWIGSKVTILDGAQLGNGCVVGAGSVVRGCFPDNVVIAGVPARIIRKRG